jgi:hypothetical protein
MPEASQSSSVRSAKNSFALSEMPKSASTDGKDEMEMKIVSVKAGLPREVIYHGVHVTTKAEGSAKIPPRGKEALWGLGTQRLRAGLNLWRAYGAGVVLTQDAEL